MNQEDLMSIEYGQLLCSTYKILEDIHKSSNTKVFKVMKKKENEDDEPMALKVIKNDKFKDKRLLEVVKKSFILMAKWENPYLMKCYRCYDGESETKL